MNIKELYCMVQLLVQFISKMECAPCPYRHASEGLTAFPDRVDIPDCTTAINLMNNSITHIDDDALVGLTSLKSVNLKQNRIDEFPNFIPVKDTIKTIFLKDNFIPILPDNFVELEALEVFSINDNPITSVPVLDGLQQLRSFYCCRTALTDIDENTFSTLNNLDFIEFTGSPLPDMNKIIIPTNVDKLFLDGTMISSIEIECAGGPGLCFLRELRISTNLQAIPVLNDVLNIQELNISDNPLQDDQLSQGLSNMFNLTVVEANNNSLSRFLDLSASRTTIEEIYLQDNNIVALDSDLIRDMTNLRILSLTGNSLHRIASSSVSHLTSLNSLDLRGQTLDCTMDWVTESAIVISDYTSSTTDLMKCQGRCQKHTEYACVL